MDNKEDSSAAQPTRPVAAPVQPNRDTSYNPSILQGASQFSLEGVNFNNVTGEQHNTHNNDKSVVRDSYNNYRNTNNRNRTDNKAWSDNRAQTMNMNKKFGKAQNGARFGPEKANRNFGPGQGRNNSDDRYYNPARSVNGGSARVPDDDEEREGNRRSPLLLESSEGTVDPEQRETLDTITGGRSGSSGRNVKERQREYAHQGGQGGNANQWMKRGGASGYLDDDGDEDENSSSDNEGDEHYDAR